MPKKYHELHNNPVAQQDSSHDMEVSIEEHQSYISKSRAQEHKGALKETAGLSHTLNETASGLVAAASRRGSFVGNQIKQQVKRGKSKLSVTIGQARHEHKSHDIADKIQTKPPRKKGLWVNKPRRNYFVVGLLGGLLAVAIVVGLWYVEYVLFKKEIDNFAYGTCGGCHCIMDTNDETCPEQPHSSETFSISLTAQLQSMVHLNPFSLICYPYTVDSTGECLSPTQDEFWDNESAVCAFVFDLNGSTTDAGCPTSYSTTSFASDDDALASGGMVTHNGACGVCSTAQDLAAYITNPNMVDLGQRCVSRGLLDPKDGLLCFRELGLTEECAKAWYYSFSYTNEQCLSTCLPVLAERKPSNGPAPTCPLNDCLQCHDDISSEVFARLAGRTRQNSGLRSAVARPCSSMAMIDHAANLPCSGNIIT